MVTPNPSRVELMRRLFVAPRLELTALIASPRTAPETRRLAERELAGRNNLALAAAAARRAARPQERRLSDRN